MNKVLVVDDDDMVRDLLFEHLSRRNFACVTADNFDSALEIIHRDPEVSVVISDIKMPGKTGLDLLAALRAEKGRDFELIVITGYGGTDEAIEALRLGVQDFLMKPIDMRELADVVKKAQERIEHRRFRRLTEETLKEVVKEKTAKISSLLVKQENAYEEGMHCLAVAAEYKDTETGNHIKRIGRYAGIFASHLGWPEDLRHRIELASPLHDIGKIGIPDSVLLKPGKLTPDERRVMKRHSEIGHKILSGSDSSMMKFAASIAWSHHERWDGTGYPRRLQGEEIPHEARITALCDVYDALRSRRPYKPPYEHEKAVSIILEEGNNGCSQFDPELLEIFRSHDDQFAKAFDQFQDGGSKESRYLDIINAVKREEGDVL